jgi:hypothetical protein
MERFKQTIALFEEPKKIERPECLAFLEQISEFTLNTFPFVSEEQKRNCEEKLNSAIGNNDDLSEKEFIKNIKIALATLENTHTKLKEDKIRNYMLEMPIFYQADKFWLKSDSGILEVVNLDGRPLRELIQEKMQETGGGTIDYKINNALDELMTSDIFSSIICEVKDGENEKDLKINFVNRNKYFENKINKDYVNGKVLDENIGYLEINSWSKDIKIDGKQIDKLIDGELEAMSECESLIIDVRENGGGSSKLAEPLAGHFIDPKDPPVNYGTVLERKNEAVELIGRELELEQQGEFLNKKIVILTGPKCLSSNEMFIMMLKDTGKAITIGQTTGGGSGNPADIELNLGEKSYSLSVSTWKMIRNNGKELEGIGIEPDIQTRTTAEDVMMKRDVELETALAYLKN